VATALARVAHPPAGDTRDVDTVLIPYLGRYRLADLDVQLLRTVLAAIADTRNSTQSASAMNHLRTTLRAALNLAVKEGVLECNPRGAA
jgi:hypothetical protein